MVKNHLCEREVWPLRKRIIELISSLETLTESGAWFRAEMNITMRTEYCVKKISEGNIFIVYTQTTNSSREGSKVIPTYLMQILNVEAITISRRVMSCVDTLVNFIHVRVFWKIVFLLILKRI